MPANFGGKGTVEGPAGTGGAGMGVQPGGGDADGRRFRDVYDAPDVAPIAVRGDHEVDTAYEVVGHVGCDGGAS